MLSVEIREFVYKSMSLADRGWLLLMPCNMDMAVIHLRGKPWRISPKQ